MVERFFPGRLRILYRFSNECGDPFDKVVNAFEYYNCGYNETGLYAAYYIDD